MARFLLEQDGNQRNHYMDLLRITGALSNLYSDNSSPFLYYRAMENIFCKAFLAENLSRGDLSADAAKDSIGIGLKTFLHNNGKTFQKVAEFNKESHLFRQSSDSKLTQDEIKKIIFAVSKMRNERINVTKRLCNVEDMIYHLITRSHYKMTIYEEHMDEIDLDSIKILSRSKNVLKFKDKYNEYSFSLSKNTLLKRFITTDNFINEIDIEIYEDPFDFLERAKNKYNIQTETAGVEEEYIVLPLYSSRSGKVENKSGLNQWNAGGRMRKENEVYLPIPKWIHKEFPDFFEYEKKASSGGALTTDSFDVLLPNKKQLKMKIAQSGGKALMSNPNADLGKWILRDVLNVKPNEIVTKEMLERIGIDSVKLTKIAQNKYALDFLQTGSFEDFRDLVLDDIS